MPERPDLSDELTVFVLTVGGPTYETCRQRLENQDCRFRLQVIENVAPMSRALQTMLDECQTPYFVQVDEDMLLYPHAIRTLHHHINNADEKAAIVTLHLHDSHAGRVIYGLKVYRHSIVRRYPYRNVEGCEFDQLSRFKPDGFLDHRLPIRDPFHPTELTLGEHHGPLYTPRTVYERYLTLERKWNRHTDATPTTSVYWVEEQAGEFLRRFLADGQLIDAYALLGVIAGRLSDVEGPGTEKDFRDYEQLPGFSHLERFFNEVDQRSRDG